MAADSPLGKKRVRRKRGPRKLTQAFPEIAPRKLVRIGKSHYIAMPPTWFKAHHLDPEKIEELLTASNTDLLILNPKSVKRFTAEVSRLIRPESLGRPSARALDDKRLLKKIAHLRKVGARGRPRKRHLKKKRVST